MTPLIIAAGPDAAELGSWLLAFGGLVAILGGVVGCAVGVKKLLERPPVPAGTEPVTRQEFADLKAAVAACATKAELAGLAGAVAKLDDYCHSSMHDVRNGIQRVELKVETIREKNDQAGAAMNRIVDRLESNSAKIERLTGVLETDHKARIERHLKEDPK